jgi:trigger factor
MRVEVAEQRVETAMRQKARELAREINVPGFRRGKAPYQVVLRRVGRESLRFEVIDDMVPNLFQDALAQTDLNQEELYAGPSLEDMTDEPLVLTFKLPLHPVATLGDYRALRREIEPIEVSEEAVDELLERVQARYAETEEVERPAEAGDLMTIGGIGKLSPLPPDETDEADGEAMADQAEEILFDQERVNVLLDSDKTFPGTPFVDNLIGLSAGEDATFIFTFSEDYDEEDLAGREANIEVSVLKVQSRQLPEIDDELAEKEGVETVDQLREKLREELYNEAEQTAKNDLLEYMVGELRKEAVLAYPPAAVEQEVTDMVEATKQQASQSGWEWDDYLMLRGETEESLRQRFQETAVEQLENRTLFMELLKLEKIQVGPSDIDAALDEQLSKYEDERLREGMREYFLKGEGINNLAAEILNQKLYQRVKEILTGNAPDLSELEIIPLEDEEE